MDDGWRGKERHFNLRELRLVQDSSYVSFAATFLYSNYIAFSVINVMICI